MFHKYSLINGLLAVTWIATSVAASAACQSGTNLLDNLAPTEKAAIFEQAEMEANGQGRLYRIDRDGTPTSYLFGTMHLTDPRITRLPDEVESAFVASGQLVLETTDLIDADALANTLLNNPNLTSLPDGTTVTDYLSGENSEELTSLAQAAGMSISDFTAMQPWLVAASLMTTACEQQRQAEGVPILDLALAQEAQQSGKSLAGLESAEEQFSAMADLPFDHQAEMLLATFKFQDRIPDILETMTALYLQGNIAAIAPALDVIAPAGSDEARSLELWQEFDERVILRRNRLMAERLEPILKQGDAFVAVGAQHLIGDEGLVELLRNGGWRLSLAAK